jgi:hypothetical protein
MHRNFQPPEWNGSQLQLADLGLLINILHSYQMFDLFLAPSRADENGVEPMFTLETQRMLEHVL